MLGNFLKIDYIVVCFLKPENSACFFTGNDKLSGKQVGSQASRRVTRRLAWIQPVCISINAVPLSSVYRNDHLSFEWPLYTGLTNLDVILSHNLGSGSAETQCNKLQEGTSAISLFASPLLYNNVVTNWA